MASGRIGSGMGRIAQTAGSPLSTTKLNLNLTRVQKLGPRFLQISGRELLVKSCANVIAILLRSST